MNKYHSFVCVTLAVLVSLSINLPNNFSIAESVIVGACSGFIVPNVYRFLIEASTYYERKNRG